MRLFEYLVIGWGWLMYYVVWRPMFAHAKWNDGLKNDCPSPQSSKPADAEVLQRMLIAVNDAETNCKDTALSSLARKLNARDSGSDHVS